MKKVTFEISMEQADKLVSELEKFHFEPYEIPGSLQDNYICNIGADSGLKLGRYKLRKYLIIREVYENPWSSGLELILTDDDRDWKAWINHYEQYMDELERKERTA